MLFVLQNILFDVSSFREVFVSQFPWLRTPNDDDIMVIITFGMWGFLFWAVSRPKFCIMNFKFDN